MSQITVIIPTYNERQTIGAVIDEIEHEIQAIPGHSVSILTVDADSPDGTADIVRQKMKSYGNLHLLVEKKKRGLGLAYVAGINYALQSLQADAFIEFDGDSQHDPKDIRRLIVEFDNGYDYVIGSRYVPGGSIPQEWELYRKLLSRWGSLFIRAALRLPTYDNTSGLKLTRAARFADKLPLSEDKILSKHHAYKIHLLYEMQALGAKVKEIPIAFHERKSGKSKSSVEDIFESLKVVSILLARRFIR